MKATEVHINFPTYIKSEHKKYFEPHLKYIIYEPEIRNKTICIIFKNGFIIDKNGIVDETLPHENFKSNTNWKYYFGKLFKNIIKFNFKFLKSKDIYFITNEFSNNYFHWITEVIPKLFFVKKATDNNFRVLLQVDNLSEFQKTTLNFLDIKYIQIKKEIIFTNNIKIIPRLTEFSGYYNKKYLLEIKQFFYNKISRKNRINKRVYITRKKAKIRKLINETKIIEILKTYNFLVLAFEDLTFIEQVEFMQNTEILISIHGAGLTNMIFMKEKSKVFEFLPENTKPDKCYFTLAQNLGHEYYYQFCKITGEFHTLSDFIIDHIEFEKKLKFIIHNS